MESEERLSCEDKIDSELKHELEQIQKALDAEVMRYLLVCDGCGHEWRADDESGDCPECDDWVEYAEVIDEDEESEYDLLAPLYIEHTVVRADRMCGGPQDFWRLYLDPDGEIERVSYHYFDWHDGAERWLSGSRLDTVKEMFGEQARCLMTNR